MKPEHRNLRLPESEVWPTLDIVWTGLSSSTEKASIGETTCLEVFGQLMTMALDSSFYELGLLHLLVAQQWYCQQFAWIILLSGGCAVLCFVRF